MLREFSSDLDKMIECCPYVDPGMLLGGNTEGLKAHLGPSEGGKGVKSLEGACFFTSE